MSFSSWDMVNLAISRHQLSLMASSLARAGFADHLKPNLPNRRHTEWHEVYRFATEVMA